MAATHIQCGVTNHRINREPLDAESVIYSYSDLRKKIDMKDNTHTYEGALYPGMVTSVINDNNDSYNGPWYISYYISGQQISYNAERIPLMSDVNSYIIDIKEEIEDLRPLITPKEDSSNKVTEITYSSTDIQYPSAKAVYDSITEAEEVATAALNDINDKKIDKSEISEYLSFGHLI